MRIKKATLTALFIALIYSGCGQDKTADRTGSKDLSHEEYFEKVKRWSFGGPIDHFTFELPLEAKIPRLVYLPPSGMGGAEMYVRIQAKPDWITQQRNKFRNRPFKHWSPSDMKENKDKIFEQTTSKYQPPLTEYAWGFLSMPEELFSERDWQHYWLEDTYPGFTAGVYFHNKNGGLISYIKAAN